MSMPVILDVGALFLTIALAVGTSLSVLGSGVDKGVNRRFALFSLSIAAWAACALLMKFQMRFRSGDCLSAAEWHLFFVGIEGPLFLLFAVRYVDGRSRKLDVLAAGFLAASAVSAIPLFLHWVLSAPRLEAEGTVRVAVSAWGYAGAVVSLASMASALAVILRRRRGKEEWPVPAGAFLLAAGFVLGDLVVQSSPVHSAFGAAGMALLSFAVMKRQMFNPLAQEVAQRRRFEEALKKRVEQQDLIARIGARTTSLLSEEGILRQTVDLVEESFGFHNVSVLLCEGEDLVLRASALPEAQAQAGQLRLRIGDQGVTGWVAAHGQPLRVPDVHRDPRSIGAWMDRGTRSELAVPIRLRGQILGVLDAESAESDGFQGAEADTLQTVADQLAVAVQNARLFATVRRDLEERRRAEEVLRESETLFRNVADQSPNMIFLHWRGAIVYANPQCARLSGYSREELCRSEFDAFSLTAPRLRADIRERFLARRSEGYVQSFEHALVTRSGRMIDTILSLQSIGYRGEMAVLGIAVDITARKKMERLLRALNAAALEMEHAQEPSGILRVAMGALVEAGFHGFLFLSDPQRRLELACHSACGMPVVTEDVDRERLMFPLEGIPLLASALEQREAAMATLPPEGLPDGIPSLQGPGREPLPVILAPLRSGDAPAGVLLVHGEWMGEEVLQPLTGFGRQIAAAWRKTSLVRDLERSLADLNRTQAQLLHAQKMEAIGRLAGGIAHDFNNVLTVISGYVSLLGESLQGPGLEKAQSDLLEIRSAVKRAASLTGRLLAFGRRKEMKPSAMDLGETVAACLKLLRPLIREDIGLDFHASEQRATVMADPDQMDQVVMNLALNAQDAMPNGGALRLETAVRDLDRAEAGGLGIPAGRFAVFSVHDTGIGMDDGVRSRIFEPFFTTKGDGKGTGLGLSIVYGLVTQWGGAVRVESSPGEGSAFSIFLPVAGEEPLAARKETPQPLPQGRGTVLLAEDDGSLRDLARRILQDAGYRVLAAGSGEEALHIASVSGAIGLLITDVVMPGGLSGVDLFHRIREVRPGLPVLFMSGYADEAEERYRVPADQPFLAKPFLPARFLGMAADLMARS